MAHDHTRDERIARALGWFSIGLGTAELLAPGGVAELAGMRGHRGNRRLLRSFGFREMASGTGILAQPREAGWVWSRVAGDAIDLATIATALRSHNNARRRRAAAAMTAVAGVALVDLYFARQLSRNATARQTGKPASRTIHTTKVVTIDRSPQELYRFWRDFRNLPKIMEHLEAVQVIDDTRSQWIAKAPAGRRVEWSAEIVDDRPDELIAWRSLEGADVPNRGSVRFQPAPGGRGTEVRVELEYTPPGGVVGSKLAKLFGEEPGQQVAADLRRFKQLMETGEVVLSEGTLPGAKAARPPEHPVTAPGRDIAVGPREEATEPAPAQAGWGDR